MTKGLQTVWLNNLRVLRYGRTFAQPVPKPFYSSISEGFSFGELLINLPHQKYGDFKPQRQPAKISSKQSFQGPLVAQLRSRFDYNDHKIIFASLHPHEFS